MCKLQKLLMNFLFVFITMFYLWKWGSAKVIHKSQENTFSVVNICVFACYFIYSVCLQHSLHSYALIIKVARIRIRTELYRVVWQYSVFLLGCQLSFLICPAVWLRCSGEAVAVTQIPLPKALMYCHELISMHFLFENELFHFILIFFYKHYFNTYAPSRNK